MASVNKVLIIGNLQSAYQTALEMIGNIVGRRSEAPVEVLTRVVPLALKTQATNSEVVHAIAGEFSRTLKINRKPPRRNTAGFFAPMKVNGRNAP